MRTPRLVLTAKLIWLLTFAAAVLLSSQESTAAVSGYGPADAHDRPVGMSSPVPEQNGPDFRIPPAPSASPLTVSSAPSTLQTSEFMAGSIVYSVVFVESSGGSGNCSPADTQTENWNAARQATVLSEISDGLAFWTSRSGGPNPLSFIADNRGVQPTSCEPITRPSSENDLWFADTLTAMGFSATPSDWYLPSLSFVDSRRTALGADWGFIIFVVDSLNDADGTFSDGTIAYAYLNGPAMVLTYDNDGWGIDNMDLVTAHEAGHIFGALDEYAASGCSTSDSWGYLNADNASCNNGGDTSDISMMGESAEMANPAVDVSASARQALGWRNPAGSVVDVVRTSTVSLTPYVPDPASDDTPMYSAAASNTAFPPEGPRTIGGVDFGTAAPVTISRVAGAEWNLDGGSFTSAGVSPDDGAFDQESETYSFSPSSGLADGTYTFGTRSTNNYGHASTLAADTLTIIFATPTPCPQPGCPTPTATATPTKQPDPGDTDGDGCSDQRENGADETLGGLRDYLNPWDFYDVPGLAGAPPDGEVDLFNDMLGVMQHYSLNGEPPYDVRFDRGPTTGPNAWNMTAPDGSIDLFIDILGVIQQYGHDCR